MFLCRKKKTCPNHDVCKLIKIIFLISLVVAICGYVYPRTIFWYKKDIYLPFYQRLNQKNIVLKVGEEYKLRVMNINKRVTFQSSDFKVATVNINGKVTAYRPGIAIIRAKYEGKVVSCKVRVVEINKSQLTLVKGEKYKLKVKGIGWGVKWSSTNRKVVTVNSFGKITAINVGKATVIARVKGKVLTCTIKVKK